MGCGGIIAHISEDEARSHNISRRCHFVNIIININVNITIAVTKKTPINIADCLNICQLSNCEDYSRVPIHVIG
jgi:hypothetical protein